MGIITCPPFYQKELPSSKSFRKGSVSNDQGAGPGVYGLPATFGILPGDSDIDRELYLSMLVDREVSRISFIASAAGGMDIEKVAEETPEKILKATIDPLVGAQPYQGRELAFKLGLKGDQIKQFVKIFLGLAQMFVDKDLALIEINPLVITDQGNLHCLDAKIGVDGNALYRQNQLREMHDPSQEDEREAGSLRGRPDVSSG